MAKVVSEADIFAELDEYFTQEQRQPGDVSITDLMAHYKIGKCAAETRMDKLAEAQPDVWLKLKVIDNGHEKWVLRKA
jgi:hypothetical protein